MADYYGFLASISAVLGGFALAFLGSVLSRPEGRVSAWTLGLSAGATAVFTVKALGWALAASDLAVATMPSGLMESLRPLHRTLSMLFIGGIYLFLAVLGVAGWMRSRAVGIATTAIAVTAGALVVYVLTFFVR
ncbi:MAG: hypothetical protein R2834_19405 [Rhodothermales bacterium]